MALSAVKIGVGQTIGGGRYTGEITGASAPDIASVVSATATLVADAASPTQAHVTTLNAAVTPLNAALTGNVVVMWDTSVITKRNQLREALRRALHAVDGGFGALSE